MVRKVAGLVLVGERGERGVRGEVISGIETGVGVGLRGMQWRGNPKAGGSLAMLCWVGTGPGKGVYLGGKVKSGRFLVSPIFFLIAAEAIVRF
jgi:hypothetical protein